MQMTGDSGGFIELSIKWKLPYNILQDPPPKTTPLQPQIPPTSPSIKASSKPKPQTPPLAKSPSKLKQPTSPTPQSSPSSKAPSKPASSPASKKPSASLTPSHPAVAQSVKPSIKKQKPPTVSTQPPPSAPPPAHVSPPPVVAGSVTKPPASSFQPAKPSRSTEAVQYSFQDSDVSVEVPKLNNSLPPLRKTADKKHGKSKKTPKVSKTRSEREAMVVQESDNNALSSGDSSDVSGGGGAKVRWPYLDAVQPVVGGGGSNGNETGASSSVSVTSEERGSAAGGHSDMKVSSGHGDTSALGVGGMVPGGWSQSDVSESGGEVVEVYEMNMSSLKVVVSDTNWPVLKETQRAQGANILAIGGGSGGSGGSDGGVASVSIVSVTDLSAESVEEELEEELEEDVSDEDTMFEETLHKASGLCMYVCVCVCSSMC